MTASEADKARMIERHKLVVNIIEVNSQQLRCESAIAGLDIERACAVRDASMPSASPEVRAAIASFDERMATLSDQRQRLETEREFLNSVLLEFDSGTPVADDDPIGRA